MIQKLYVALALIVLSGCSEQRDCCLPGFLVSGNYIGPFTYIHQGKNPIDGAVYHDTTYTDTFQVSLFAGEDSIRFVNNSFRVEFKTRDYQTYTTGPYTTYRLVNMDSMYYDSYFYSGTDADHFYSETFSFRGRKK